MAKKHLVIVESPAKAKTIGKYLGKDYEVKASMGHLRDLPKSKLGVDIEHDFEPVYQPIRGKEELISELKKAAKSSDTVYLSTRSRKRSSPRASRSRAPSTRIWSTRSRRAACSTASWAIS